MNRSVDDEFLTVQTVRSQPQGSRARFQPVIGGG